MKENDVKQVKRQQGDAFSAVQQQHIWPDLTNRDYSKEIKTAAAHFRQPI